MKQRIAIFASGNGSNAEAIINHFSGTENEIALILSNNTDAFVLQRAKKHGIPSIVFAASELKTGKVLAGLQAHTVDFIVLAGFMKLIPLKIVAAYPNRIVNIHPALLPKYGGKGMYGINVHTAVIKANEKESGITIHYVNEHYDEGNTIFQAVCEVLPTDSPNDLAERIHGLEHAHFPKVIADLVGKL